MTEITKTKEGRQRYSVNPTAFFFALICAPLVVTLFSFWTVIGLFALPFGIIPYLVLGTPVLLWAVGWLKPAFGSYAMLGLLGNTAMGIAGVLILVPTYGAHEAYEIVGFVAGFGLIFAPLYAGAFGSLYASFHPNIRILQT